MSKDMKDGAAWLEKTLSNMCQYKKPSGFWWRGVAYKIGDPLPEDLVQLLDDVLRNRKQACVTEPGAQC